MISIKKSIIAAVLILVLCLSGCGGKISKELKVIPGEASEIYTEEDIEKAIEAAESYFKKEFKGCTLTEIGYAGDEVSLDHKDWADRNAADEVIVLTSSFTVDSSGGDGSLNPDSTYKNWKWIFIRTEGGRWVHADHGY